MLDGHGGQFALRLFLPLANPKTPGDLFFEDYCDLNGYLWTYEPRLRSSTAPDYLIDRAGDRAVVEVKHFTVTRQLERLMAAPGRALFVESTVGNVQSAVREGGEQLRPCAGLELPLVIVLTNPLDTDVDLDRDDVVSALLGRTALLVDLDHPGHEQMVYSGENAAVLHRTAAATINRLPHISAVVAMYGTALFPQADVYDLSRAHGFTGTPLPRTFFDGDNDAWLGFLGPERFGLCRLSDRAPPAAPATRTLASEPHRRSKP